MSILGRKSTSHDDFFRWLFVMALIGFAALILWDYGFIHYLLRNDVSHVSAAILTLFVMGTLYCFWQLYQLSKGLGLLESTSENAGFGPIGRAVQDLRSLKSTNPGNSAELLLQATASSLRTPVRFGVFVADILYKMGLLGTVIGFILMLDSMRGLGDFDTETMRSALQQMTTGMAVALLTTVTGLVCGALLRFQFVLLENLNQRVMRRLVRLSEIELNDPTIAVRRV